MNTTARVNLQEAEAKFSRHQKWLQRSFLFFAIVSISRIPAIASVLGEWTRLGVWVHFLACIVIVLFAVMAFRCTICGGGIKVGGMKCAKCGHNFSKSHEGRK